MTAPLATDIQLERFSGTAPLFPLPSVALLPHVVQPLHVFEERYRILTAHALEGERLIAMALLQPGWESKYDQNDVPVEPTVCLARIEIDQRLPDGRFLLLMRGLIRARITAELPAELPYRRAKLQLLPDLYSDQPVIDRHRRRRELLESFLKRRPGIEFAAEFPQLIDGDLGLGALCDLLAFAEQLDADDARSLLNESRVDVRSDLLLDALRRRARPGNAGTDFPPSFSAN